MNVAWRLRIHESLPSTSDLCIQLAQQNEPEGLAVMARRQTAGRGSRGRVWETLDSNLALSALIRPTGPATDAGKWALLGALAFRDALATVADGLTLKWPNDVLRHGAKVGGLLVDASTDGASLHWLVLGFGANLGRAPGQIDATHPPGYLGAHAPEPIARTLLDRLTDWRRIWLLDGFGAIRHAWLAAAHPPGTKLRVRTGGHDVAGTFEGLSDDGALLLATGGRVRAFSTGEVLLGC